jgi:hypothetical protein
MIKSQRKRHRTIWIAWAILLPPGILFAWLAIPNQPPVKLLQEQQPVLLPVIVRSKILDNYEIVMRTTKENDQWQLEWNNKTALTVPSAVIYNITDSASKVTDNELIGRIEARGSYVFQLHMKIPAGKQLKLVLYDFIHEEIIEQVNF